jgi:5-methylcytosine-specific restriction endonuclease McrA
VSPRRTCIRSGPGCSDNGVAVPGRSRCRAHGGGAWARRNPEREAEYASPEYRRNRPIAIRREPVCHWCREQPSTTADHVISLAKGGSHSLENLVGSCADCNMKRGAAEGRATEKRALERGKHA